MQRRFWFVYLQRRNYLWEIMKVLETGKWQICFWKEWLIDSWGLFLVNDNSFVAISDKHILKELNTSTTHSFQSQIYFRFCSFDISKYFGLTFLEWSITVHRSVTGIEILARAIFSSYLLSIFGSRSFQKATESLYLGTVL